jgi:hypothetical protein
MREIASAATDAAEALKNAAKDKVLVKDLLGTTINGPDGKAIGTVENLVVIPGGRVVAAILATGGKTGRIPVPFTAVKISKSAGQLEARLPMSLTELRNMKEVQQLGDVLPGL